MSIAEVIEKKDSVLPGEKWAFDGDVTNVFDDMLARSIPQYVEMRRLCFTLGSRFVQPKTSIVDLGCSRGEALAPFVDKFGANNRFVGVEVSEPMIDAARTRYEGYINCGVVDVRHLDLRSAYPSDISSLTLCVLTLQFTPIEYRQQIVRNIFKQTISGGALVLVEKTIGATADIDSLFVDRYLDMKRENGYTEEQIQRKKMSLEGVLVPVTARWNEELLSAAGFRQIDCFWRWLNFAGWLAVKE